MKIFLLGASGYIGGTVATALQTMGHELVATARTPARAAELAARGIAATVAALDDRGAIEALARTADAVISAADADHRPSVEAVVAAAPRRLIHTSGSSLVATDSQGAFLAPIYDETSLPVFDAAKQARASIDALVRDAGGIVICPTLVYGRGAGLHADSIQVPLLERAARDLGIVPYIGRGENVWSHVHIRDLADLYVLALSRAPAGAFLFAEAGEATMRDLATALGRRLALPAESIDIARADALWGTGLARYGLGSNSRVRATAARALGWQPRGPSLAASIATGA